jgi:hypothetical protein
LLKPGLAVFMMSGSARRRSTVHFFAATSAHARNFIAFIRRIKGDKP